jgi:hypothetical protein
MRGAARVSGPRGNLPGGGGALIRATPVVTLKVRCGATSGRPRKAGKE